MRMPWTRMLASRPALHLARHVVRGALRHKGEARTTKIAAGRALARCLAGGQRRNGGGGNVFGSVMTSATTAVAGVMVASWALRQEDERTVNAAGAYAIPIGQSFPDICNCFIEVSRESRMKYEWNEETNMLKLDRVLHGAAFYPHDYGFIPQTLCGDGDPLDVLVLGTSALQPGAIVDIRPLGYMVMEDEKGLDEKVLAVPAKDPRFNHMNSLRDVPEHVLREITNFFETYKQLEKAKWVKVGGWKGTMDTHELIEQTHASYRTAKEKDVQNHSMKQEVKQGAQQGA